MNVQERVSTEKIDLFSFKTGEISLWIQRESMLPSYDRRSNDDQHHNICTYLSSIPSAIGSWLQFPQVITMQSGRQVQILHELAEGGFSFVYEVRDKNTEKHYAMKKVLCQTPQQVELIKKEMQYHKNLTHPHLLALEDFAVEHVIESGGHQTYYLLFELYWRGSLRNHLNHLQESRKNMPEGFILHLFERICQAVAVFHSHTPALAHRDIKPENVLLTSDLQSPVVIDFGSVTEANVVITTRLEALQLQEAAAQYSSMSYRAPELFDVPTHSHIGTSTDIWSLGALLYAMAFTYSPFESSWNSKGEIRVIECTYLKVIGKVEFPPSCPYSVGMLDLIRWMLTVEPSLRPAIHDVLEKLIILKDQRKQSSKS